MFRWAGAQQQQQYHAPGEAPEDKVLFKDIAGSSGDDDTVRLIKSNAPETSSHDMVEEVGPMGPSSESGFRYYARSTLHFLLVNWYKLVILGLLIALIVLTAVKGFSIFGDLLGWFQARNNWGGWGIFVGMYTALVALFLPGVVFIMGAGFVFGFWKGLLAVWVGGAIGQALAFLLARYLLKDWVEATLRGKWRRWEVIDRAIEHDGWKLVLIMRMSPVIPYNLLNIAMATTSMPFWQFTLVSAVGIVFECGIFCYIGSVASSIPSILSGDAKGSVVEWVLLGLSLVMCVFGAVFVSYSIKSAVRRADEYHAANSVHGGEAGVLATDSPPMEARPTAGTLEMDSPPARRGSSVLSYRSPSPLHERTGSGWDLEAGPAPASSARQFELRTVSSAGSSGIAFRRHGAPPLSVAVPEAEGTGSSGPPAAHFTLRGPAKLKASPMPLAGGTGEAGDAATATAPLPVQQDWSSRAGGHGSAGSADVELGESVPKLRRPSPASLDGSGGG